jgi:hypothetical protein
VTTRTTRTTAEDGRTDDSVAMADEPALARRAAIDKPPTMTDDDEGKRVDDRRRRQ